VAPATSSGIPSASQCASSEKQVHVGSEEHDDDLSEDCDDSLSAEQTTTLKVPSPCQSGCDGDDPCVYYDVSSLLELPTSKISLSFNGIHNSHYIGVNRIRLLDEQRQEIDFTVARADGRVKDPDAQLRYRGQADSWRIFCHGEGAGAWWAVAGNEHEVVLHLPGEAMIFWVGVWCVNPDACPLQLQVDDVDQVNADKKKANWSKDRSLPLGTSSTIPSTLLHGGSSVPLEAIAKRLNRGKLHCSKGFRSFYSSDVGGACVLHRKGKAAAARCYFGARHAMNFAAVELCIPPEKPGCWIERTEERAISLHELRKLRATIIARCCAERWIEPGGKQVLLPEEVNLYHLNYHHICPWTVPAGLVLEGLRKARYGCGQEVVQEGRLGAARGFITVALRPRCVSVRVFAGTFKEGVPLTVDGVPSGSPSTVCHEGSCSYKELISDDRLLPSMFCSHFWGESVLDFVRCCEEHACCRKMDDGEGFWVCAYANRQHDLGQDLVQNPEETSFRKAMLLAVGILIILDENATAFTRIWCDFEIWTTIRDVDKTIDIVTMHEDRPHLISQGLFPGEVSFDKAERERDFPLKLLGAGLCTELQKGSSSVEVDKVRILNCMVGNTSDLDSVDILRRLEAGGPLAADELEVFNRANHALNRLVGLAAWPIALKGGIVTNFPVSSGSVNLQDIVMRDMTCENVALHLGSFEEVTDHELEVLMRSLPPSLGALRLNVSGCNNITSNGFSMFANMLPSSLHTLVLVADNVIDDEGIYALGESISSLPDLKMLAVASRRFNLEDQKEHGFDGITDNSLVALASSLPKSMTSIKLDLHCNSGVTERGIRAIVEALPVDLVDLELQLGAVVSKENFPVKAALPSGLKKLVLSVEQSPEGLDGAHMDNDGILAILPWLPEEIEDFSLQISAYNPVTSGGIKEFSQRLPSSLKRFWLNLGGLGSVPESLAELGEKLADRGISFELHSQIHKKPDFVFKLA